MQAAVLHETIPPDSGVAGYPHRRARLVSSIAVADYVADSRRRHVERARATAHARVRREEFLDRGAAQQHW